MNEDQRARVQELVEELDSLVPRTNAIVVMSVFGVGFVTITHWIFRENTPVEREKKARTVTLKPEMETILRERAGRAGQDVDTFTNTLLADVLADDPDDLTEDEMVEIRAGIERGLEAAATRRVRSAADYKADVMKRRTERQAISRSRERTNGLSSSVQ